LSDYKNFNVKETKGTFTFTWQILQQAVRWCKILTKLYLLIAAAAVVVVVVAAVSGTFRILCRIINRKATEHLLKFDINKGKIPNITK
jgi:hypothetical protein